MADVRDFFVRCGGTRIKYGLCERCGAARRGVRPCKRQYPRALKFSGWWVLTERAGCIYYRQGITQVTPANLWWRGRFKTSEVVSRYVVAVLTGDVLALDWRERDED